MRQQVPRPAGQAAPAVRDPFLRDVLAGLSRRPRAIPSRWFYDARGSRLFQWITRLPEYYLTRVELEILQRHGDRIAAPFAGARCTVVDLGAGDGHKTRAVLERLLRGGPVTYAPIDLSPAAVEEAASSVRAALPEVEVVPLCAEYTAGLRALGASPRSGALLVLFLGSSIGNLERPAAGAFLRALRHRLRPGDHALVGFDLVKDVPLLRAAYDDAQGVTAAFNLNLLARIDRELGADFDPGAFQHRATFDPRRPAMESWLVSRRRQRVTVAGHAFAFEAGEAIHTEISCKYREADVAAFAREAGFEELDLLCDERRWFCDALWRAPPGR
ncbi:MAG TPA: L-histidine N(alpha)-methyltransferase [Anaeromyxobacteraceae bacterium]|nr:L-histidine N(alpha)-methyltransferase [Anaeromyxobacteraceae bacterium]